MINFALKQTRRWMPVIKSNASYRKLFNKALDNFELNKLEEQHATLAFAGARRSKKAGF